MKKALMIRVSILIAVGLIMFMSTAEAIFEKASTSKDDVEALRAQVAEMQGKILVLERKLSAEKAAPVATQPTAPAVQADDEDPFVMVDALDRHMQSMFGQYGFGITSMPGVRGYEGGFSPDYDIKEGDKSYVLTFDMPGMDKSKISVEVKEGILLVSGERSSETQQGQPNKVYRQQRSFGYFSRMIPLPKDIGPDSVQAKYDNGVLVVTVARKEYIQKKEASQKVEVK